VYKTVTLMYFKCLVTKCDVFFQSKTDSVRGVNPVEYLRSLSDNWALAAMVRESRQWAMRTQPKAGSDRGDGGTWVKRQYI
jgi:hypothetical protein